MLSSKQKMEFLSKYGADIRRVLRQMQLWKGFFCMRVYNWQCRVPHFASSGRLSHRIDVATFWSVINLSVEMPTHKKPIHLQLLRWTTVHWCHRQDDQRFIPFYKRFVALQILCQVHLMRCILSRSTFFIINRFTFVIFCHFDCNSV